MKTRKYTRNNHQFSYVLNNSNEVIAVVPENNADSTLYCNKCETKISELEFSLSVISFDDCLCAKCLDKLMNEYNEHCGKIHMLHWVQQIEKPSDLLTIRKNFSYAAIDSLVDLENYPLQWNGQELISTITGEIVGHI